LELKVVEEEMTRLEFGQKDRKILFVQTEKYYLFRQKIFICSDRIFFFGSDRKVFLAQTEKYFSLDR